MEVLTDCKKWVMLGRMFGLPKLLKDELLGQMLLADGKK